MGYETRSRHGSPIFFAATRPDAVRGARFSRTPGGDLWVSVFAPCLGDVVLTVEERRGLLAWLKAQFPEDWDGYG